MTLIVNKFQMVFKNYILKEITYVIVLCKETPPTRHLERNEALRSVVNLALTLLVYKQ